MGGKYCVAGTPNNASCTNTYYTEGIPKAMHVFSTNAETRRKWVSRKKTSKNFTLDSIKALSSALNTSSSCYSSPSVPIQGFKFRRKLHPGLVPIQDTVLPAGPAVLNEGRKGQLCEVIVCLYFARKRMPLFFKIYDRTWRARNACIDTTNKLEYSKKLTSSGCRDLVSYIHRHLMQI